MAPSRGDGTPSKLVDDVGEGGVVFGWDVVVDGDADGAVLPGSGGMAKSGTGRFQRGRGCGRGRRLAGGVCGGREGRGREHGGGGGDEGDLGGGAFGDGSPEDAAEGEAALECHEVGAESAGLDPGGDGELDGRR